MRVSRQFQPLQAGRTFTLSHRALLKQETDNVPEKERTNERQHPNVDEFRNTQIERPLNPHLTNTTSAIHNEKDVPKVGFDNVPPEFLSKVDPNYVPKDKIPENTERMTGGTQPGDGDSSKVSANGSSDSGEWAVGEMEGAEFRIEPLRRTGEDVPTMRARLTCWSYFFLFLANQMLTLSLYRPKPKTRDIRVRSPSLYLCQ